MSPLGPDVVDAAVADVVDIGGDDDNAAAAENFLPIDMDNMELDQDHPEEHVDRHQVSLFFSV